MLLDTLSLQLRVVFPLPLQVCLAAAALVLALPRLTALGAGHGATVRADESLLLGPGKESGGTLDAPLEVGVLQECSIAELALKQLVYVAVENALQEDVQVGEVLQVLILMLGFVAQLGQFAKGATAIVDTAIGDLWIENVLIYNSLRIIEAL